MNTTPNTFSPLSQEPSIPELPLITTTLSGCAYRPRNSIWSYIDGIDRVSIDFRAFERRATPELINSFKAVLVQCNYDQAPRTILAHAYIFEKFLNAAPGDAAIEIIDECHVVQVWRDEKLSQNSLPALRTLFARWEKLKYPGVSAEAISFMKRQHYDYPIPGESVRTWDPIDGPFTDIEYQGLYQGLEDAYANGDTDRYRFLAAWFTATFGLRPRQLALMKVCDLAITTMDGHIKYMVRVPLIKQKVTTLRAQMVEMTLIPHIGEILAQHVSHVRSLLTGKIDDLNNAPLFPSARTMRQGLGRNETHREAHRIPTFSSVTEEYSPIGESWGRGYEFHSSIYGIRKLVEDAFNHVEKTSERVGGDLVINARRFKKTFGTRLARDNVPRSVMAKLLFHSTAKSSESYVAMSTGLYERLDRAMAEKLAPIANAFRGIVIADLDAELHGVVVSDPRLSSGELGMCSKCGGCSLSVPIACYTCKKFRPWKDGEHEAVLTLLENRREALTATSETTRRVMHDRTILAVTQVIQQCAEMRRS